MKINSLTIRVPAPRRTNQCAAQVRARIIATTTQTELRRRLGQK